MAEVVAAERSRVSALEIERDTVLAERDAAQAEIEKLRLLIRQLQRGRFGRRSERLDPDQLVWGSLCQALRVATFSRPGVSAARGSIPVERTTDDDRRGAHHWARTIVPQACIRSTRAGSGP